MFDLVVTFDRAGGIASTGPMRDINTSTIRKRKSEVLLVTIAEAEHAGCFYSFSEVLKDCTKSTLVCSTALFTEVLQHKEMRFAYITRVHRVLYCDEQIDLSTTNKILSALNSLTSGTCAIKLENKQVLTYDTTQYYR